MKHSISYLGAFPGKSIQFPGWSNSLISVHPSWTVIQLLFKLLLLTGNLSSYSLQIVLAVAPCFGRCQISLVEVFSCVCPPAPLIVIAPCMVFCMFVCHCRGDVGWEVQVQDVAGGDGGVLPGAAGNVRHHQAARAGTAESAAATHGLPYRSCVCVLPMTWGRRSWTCPQYLLAF